MIQLEKPVLTTISKSDLAPEVDEAFQLATALSEKGYSYIQGGSEYRKFNTNIDELNVALHATCQVVLTRSKNLSVNTARFQVASLVNGWEMELSFYRDNASMLSLDTEYDQYVLGFFREVA